MPTPSELSLCGCSSGSLVNAGSVKVQKSSLTTDQVIIVVIITWPEKIDFVLLPEHDVIGILT